MVVMMRKPVILLLALPLLVAACGGTDDDGGGGAPAREPAERPVVVATTTQLGDIVRQVAGDGAEVHQILQPNTDPHDYEPRPDDVKSVANAKVVFASGNELDHWIEDLTKQAGGGRAELTIAPDHTPQKVEAAEGGHAARKRRRARRRGGGVRARRRTGGTTRATSRRPSARSRPS